MTAPCFNRIIKIPAQKKEDEAVYLYVINTTHKDWIGKNKKRN